MRTRYCRQVCAVVQSGAVLDPGRREVTVDFRLEMVTVPVADVDRALAFYVDRVGFHVNQDVQVDDTHRFVELVPPGSGCSIALTEGYVDASPGSLQGTQLNVDDVDAARTHLHERGVEVSAVQAYPWGRFCFFTDVDGNGWSVHEVPAPGR
jgi:catechol 2,3-dioxygenase-like lactoylglutathione lyase family enzyme